MKKLSEKQKEKIQEKKKIIKILHSLYLDIWKKRRHNSEVSGRWLGKEPLSIFFHHILPKRNYPDALFDEENIIMLTPDEHSKVENDSLFYEEINIRRVKLREKYDRNSKKLLE